MNLLLNKNAKASDFVAPFAPSRAVDGRLYPIQRWLCNTVPCWISVDMGAEYWIDRWVVIHMGDIAAEWSRGYNLSDFKLQASLDYMNWIDVDVVKNNALAETDRTFTPVKARYVRVVVTKGLQINPHMASIVEFGVFEAAPTSSYLADLESFTLQGDQLPLDPAFVKDTLNYSIFTSDQIITLKATPEDPHAVMTIDGIPVESGEPFNAAWSDDNTIEIIVTPKVGEARTYTLSRTTDSYLSILKVRGGTADQLDPSFDKNQLNYIFASERSSIKMGATAEDPNAKVSFIVDDQAPTTNQPLTVPLTAGKTTVIKIEVVPVAGSKRVYQVDASLK